MSSSGKPGDDVDVSFCFTFEVLFDPVDQRLTGQKLFQTDRVLLGDFGQLLFGLKQIFTEGSQDSLLEAVLPLLKSPAQDSRIIRIRT